MRNFFVHEQCGVGLVELIFVVAILAILLALGLPSFGNLVHSAQARGARENLITSLNLARASAITRHKDVVVCPSRNQTQCDSSIWWQSGWIVFEDADRDGKRSGQETLLEAVQAQPGTMIVTSNGRKYVTYRDDGGAAGTNLTYTVCDKRGPKLATTLVINNAGRIRQGTPTAAQAETACAGP